MIPDFVTNPDPSIYHTGKYLVLDFETSNEEHGTALNPKNKLVLACWVVGQGDAIIKRSYCFGNEYEMSALVDAIADVDFIIAQNAKFELQWLDRCGYDIGSKPVYDTMLGEWVLAGNRRWSFNFDAMASKYGIQTKSNLVKNLIQGGVSSEDIPRSILLKYCINDVIGTLGIFRAQLRECDGTRLLPIIYTRCLTTLALADIEKNGIFLDAEAVEDEYANVLREYVEVSQELEKIAGDINMNSGPQKAEFIYETLGFRELVSPYTGKPLRTPGGAPKTDADTIRALVPETEEQRRFIDLKLREGKLNAALTKNLDFFVGICRERGGLFYGELRQATTRTHRLSSAGRPVQFEEFAKPKSCQFQNLPNQYKRLISARHPGWLVAEADGSQLEFRVGGHLGRDSQIRSDILHKEDIHSCTAEALTKAGEPTSRRDAKASTFRPMYGGTRGSPAIEAYCKFFADKYHELHATQVDWAGEAAARGMIETEWGMRYYFPDVKVERSGYIKGQQKVFNYPIQALATAEIIPIGLVHFWYRVRNAELIITNTVHDSIICEVPPHEIELFEEAVVKSLSTDVYNYLHKLYNLDLSIPLGVGIKLGSHWGVSAYSDQELEKLAEPIKSVTGYEPVIDDGEIAVDIPNPFIDEEYNYAS